MESDEKYWWFRVDSLNFSGIVLIEEIRKCILLKIDVGIGMACIHDFDTGLVVKVNIKALMEIIPSQKKSDAIVDYYNGMNEIHEDQYEISEDLNKKYNIF